VDGLLQFLRNLGAGRLIALAGTMAAMLAFFIWLTTRLTTPTMVPLAGQLELDEAGKVAARLDALGVPYVAKGSGIIMVPEDQVARLRMTLAKDGLPSGGGIGFEIFDRSDALGTTSFVQNVNYSRALEGELARTIRTIGSVGSARVHLVLPKREPFSRDAKESSASITLTMRGAARLDRAQVQAIQHLVATAVPDLKPSQISIVDEKGTLLAKGGLDGGAFGLGTTQMEELRTGHETRLRQAIITALEPVVGSGKVRAVVAVDLEMERVTSQSESYDTDGQVLRSSQSVEESSSSNENEPDKAVTAQNNLPEAQKNQQQPAAPKSASSNSRAEKTENFEIGKKVVSQVREAGGLKRISAAVLVDGVYTTDAQGKRTYAPRDEETLKKLDALVRSAVMFTEVRGDRVEVANLRFADPKEEAALAGELPPEPFLGLTKSDYFRIAELAALGLLGALVLLLVVRPVIGRLLQAESGPPAPSPGHPQLTTTATGQMALPRPDGTMPTVQEGEAGLPAPAMPQMPSASEMIDLAQVEGRVKQSSLSKVGEIVTRHPDQALTIVRNWLHEPART
jgi:flagellar M-ring protein FliF